MNILPTLRRILLLALAIFRGNSFANFAGDAQTKKKRPGNPRQETHQAATK